jgi:AP2 domain
MPFPESAAPFKIDGVYCRLIPLTIGQHAIVWESDYIDLMRWKWQASWDESVASFYATRRERKGGRRLNIKMHRQILGLEDGDKRKGDHWNQVTLDNRRTNLRIAKNQQSSQNQKLRSDSLTGYKGVHLHRQTGKWQARIMVNGVRLHLGLFGTPESAYKAYCSKAVEHFGEFARLS